jgi:hypothetical protein
LVKQWSLEQTADEADWLIGAEIFTPSIGADALRSMKAPGTAYDNAFFGKDPQPDHMRKYAQLPNTDEGDYGGVHINSGIPNKAFYLTATKIGGCAWEAPGQIWYAALKASGPLTEFQGFADATHMQAGQLYGIGSTEQEAVAEAWQEVGIRISGAQARPYPRKRPRRHPGDGDTGQEQEPLAALTKQVEAMAVQVEALAKDVSQLKGKRSSSEGGWQAPQPGNAPGRQASQRKHS